MNTEGVSTVATGVPTGLSLPIIGQKATFASLYSKAALYEAALRVYTKPLFYREKGLIASHDGRTLYHFASHGPRNLEGLHDRLLRRQFRFREGIEVHFTRHRKHRTVYVFPWEERIVDMVLYQTLNRFCHTAFSQDTYAFRHRGFGVDDCQYQITRHLKASPRPLYLMTRDVSNYFPSVDQELLLRLLVQWIEEDDYLYELLRDRIRFRIRTDNGDKTPGRGIPLGTALACLLANIYLTPLDYEMAGVPGLTYFRYSDDILAFSQSPDAVLRGSELLNCMLAGLRLKSKTAREMNLLFANASEVHPKFRCVSKFRHLGLEFRVDGSVGLSRDKGRKICNLFRRGFQNIKVELQALKGPQERIELLVSTARRVIEKGVRSIAILDYYLKHVDDEKQLRLIDRWLAEEVLARAFQGGHSKGNFRRLPFRRLRQMGLPSLRHRHRLLHHGKINSSFFMLWTNQLFEPERSKENTDKAGCGRRGGDCQVERTLSPHLEAAAGTRREIGGCL